MEKNQPEPAPEKTSGSVPGNETIPAPPTQNKPEDSDVGSAALNEEGRFPIEESDDEDDNK